MALFGTAGIRGPVPERVSTELALAVGQAAGRDGTAFVLGRDGRETGIGLAAAVEAGLASAGARVLRAGQVPTPALAYASRGRHGIMVTASHNPPGDNGLKLFADGREYDRTAERRIADRVEADERPAGAVWGDTHRIDVLSAYREAVVTYATRFGAALDDLRVAVDAGNGMGAMATPRVLDRLGAEVVTLHADVDARFRGRAPKPTPESLADLRAFVADDGAAVGIAHDGDADRVVVLDANGDIVHEDTVLAILAEHYVSQSDAGDPVVVTTPNASARVDERVDAAGGRTERVRLGALHEGIMAVASEGDDDTAVAFAGEPWKHTHPDFGPWIDGVASAAVLARLIAEHGLEGLRAPVNERPARKRNVECPDDAKAAAMERLEETLPAAFPDATVDLAHGVRLTWDGEWVLVRPSGTEPYLRVYAEHADVTAVMEQIIQVVEAAIDETSAAP